jgi:hypothetical protein
MKNKNFSFIKITVLILILVICKNSNAQVVTCRVPKCDEDIIVEYVKQNLKVKSLYVAPTSIPFQLEAVGESIIGSDYIPGFKYRNGEGDNKMIIDKVKDSLSKRSDYLNTQIGKCDHAFIELSRESKDNFVLFLSSKYENTIYGEIVERSAIRYSDGKYEFSGIAYSFVFMVADNIQLKVYEGRINYQ